MSRYDFLIGKRVNTPNGKGTIVKYSIDKCMISLRVELDSKSCPVTDYYMHDVEVLENE